MGHRKTMARLVITRGATTLLLGWVFSATKVCTWGHLVYIYIYNTLWLLNVAMENERFMSIYR